MLDAGTLCGTKQLTRLVRLLVPPVTSNIKGSLLDISQGAMFVCKALLWPGHVHGQLSHAFNLQHIEALLNRLVVGYTHAHMYALHAVACSAQARATSSCGVINNQ